MSSKLIYVVHRREGFIEAADCGLECGPDAQQILHRSQANEADARHLRNVERPEKNLRQSRTLNILFPG
jgi:hypothetical protein